MPELFDDLTRILGSGMSRREAIRTVLGAAAGGYVSRLLATTGIASLGWPDGAAATIVGVSWAARAGKPTKKCEEKNCPEGDLPKDRICSTPSNSCCPEKYVACMGEDAGLCCPADQPQCCPGFPGQSATRCCPAPAKDWECCGLAAKCCDRRGKVEQCCQDERGDLICCLQRDNCCCPDESKPGKPLTCKPRSKLKLEAYHTEPRNQIEMSVRDPSGTGLTRISVVVNVNADVVIPVLRPGSTYARVTATRVDQSKPARVVLQACTACGKGECCVDGDPVLTTLQIPSGKRSVRDTFADIPKVEHFITVQNGRPGLRRVRVNVNGLAAGSLRLRSREVGMLDIARYMMSKKNIITLTGEGAPGSSALVIISDVPGVQGAPNASILPSAILWEASPWKPDVDLHWGR